MGSETVAIAKTANKATASGESNYEEKPISKAGETDLQSIRFYLPPIIGYNLG